MEVKFFGKSKTARKIKVNFDDIKVTINVFYGCCSIDKPRELLGKDKLDICRNLFIQNYLWLNGWDLSEDDDYSTETLKKQFFKEYEKGRIFEHEIDYLVENVLSDYYKNKDNYPTFKNIINYDF